MRGGFRIGKLFGIALAVHYTWFLAFVLITWSLAQGFFPQQYPGWNITTYWTLGVVSALLLFLSVLLHELAHIKNRDMLIGTMAATLAGAISTLAFFARWGAMFGGFGGRDDDNGGIIGLLVAAIVAPLAAFVIQMMVSRSREYGADATGAQIAGSPYGLANALGKLEAAAQRAPMKANPASAHMFIVNPLRGKSVWNLLSTHPPIPERIRRLKETRA